MLLLCPPLGVHSICPNLLPVSFLRPVLPLRGGALPSKEFHDALQKALGPLFAKLTDEFVSHLHAAVDGFPDALSTLHPAVCACDDAADIHGVKASLRRLVFKKLTGHLLLCLACLVPLVTDSSDDIRCLWSEFTRL